MILPSNKSFGKVFTVFFFIVALLPLRHHHPIRLWSLCASLAVLTLAYAAPKVLTPFNFLWMKLGSLLHHITTPLILTLLFFVVFVPMGILLRLFGETSLRLKFEPKAPSYWIDREPPGPARESFLNQF